MFKRTRWTLLGAAAGVGGSMWARRRVRRAVGRYLPEQIGADLRHRLGEAGEDLRAAFGEGRSAMAEREAELRARLPRSGAAPVPPERGSVIEARPVDRALPAGQRGRGDGAART